MQSEVDTFGLVVCGMHREIVEHPKNMPVVFVDEIENFGYGIYPLPVTFAY